MTHHVRPFAALAGAAVLTLGACGSSGPSDEPDSAVVTAATTCAALRTLDNDLVHAVNASVASINSLAPDERMDAILDGVDSVGGVLDDWAATVDELDLPDTAHTDELRRELQLGADQAADELAAQREEFEGQPAVVVDSEVQGIVGIWFNSIEKVMSVIEPEMAHFDDDEFEQAFQLEPDCRHVIQRYTVD